MLLSLFLVSQTIFGGFFPSQTKHYPVEFLCIPFLVWLAFRFGARAAATATFMLSVITIHGTLHGSGPFAIASANESLLLVQAFMSVTTVMTLLLAAGVSDRRQTDGALRHRAIRDSVTGVADHRRVIEAREPDTKR